WTDREGARQPLPEPPHPWGQVSVSPDGKRIAGSIRAGSLDAITSDIWLYDVERRTLTRLTFDGNNYAPIWTPDGRWVTYDSAREGHRGIYRIAADKSSAEPEVVVATDPNIAEPTSWTGRDGRTIVYHERDAGKRQIWFLPVADQAGQ